MTESPRRNPQQAEPTGLDDIAAAIAGFSAIADPLDAEIVASAIIGLLDQLVEEADALHSEEALLGGVVRAAEAIADSGALTFLTAVGAIDARPFGESAAAAASRLLAGGVPATPRLAELSTPPVVRECFFLSDQDDEPLAMAVGFTRSDAQHSFVVLTEPADHGAATEILLLPGDRLSDTVAEIRRSAQRDAITLTESVVPPAYLRYRLERALTMRDGDEPTTTSVEYRALEPLLRSRLRRLPTFR